MQIAKLTSLTSKHKIFCQIPIYTNILHYSNCILKWVDLNIFLMILTNNFIDIVVFMIFSSKASNFGVLFYAQSQTRLQLQLAPSLEHQVAAMLSILVRYNWQQFSVVTSEIAGHDDFKQAVRDKVAEMKSQQKFR